MLTKRVFSAAESSAQQEGCITAEISGHMPEIMFDSLAAAGSTVWGVMRSLPLGYVQAEAYRQLLTGDAAEELEPLLRRDSAVTLSFELPGSLHTVKISRSAA